MSIDPLKAFASTAVGSLRPATTAAGRPAETSFSTLLSAAAASSLSAPAVAREATELVRQARLQMMQGLFDLGLESTDESLSTLLVDVAGRLDLQSGAGQNLDSRGVVLSNYQPSLLKPAPTGRDQIEQLIERVAQQVSLAPELIRSVVSAESNFTPDAVSAAGAEGLMQLMPATARELDVKDSFDPQQNLLGGSRYLKQLLDKYDGDLDQALAAYNWGQGNVDRRGLEQMPQETRDYLAKVKQGLTQRSV